MGTMLPNAGWRDAMQFQPPPAFEPRSQQLILPPQIPSPMAPAGPAFGGAPAPAPGMDPGMGGMAGAMPPMPMSTPGPMDMLSSVPPPSPAYVPPGPLSTPLWYEAPPKPKKEDIQEEAENERSVHQDRVAVALEMQRRLNQERVGINKKDKELIDIGEVEVGYHSDLVDEHRGYCNYLASMEWNIKVPLKDSIDRDETIAKEDFGHYLFECFQRQHEEAGNAPLKWALPDTLGKYGMLVASLVIDPLNDECGFRFRMHDPATVFPVFEGGMGLSRLYRIYQATAAEVIGAFFDAKGTTAKKVKKLAMMGKRYKPTHVGEVVEYWDRANVLVLFDGEEIFYRNHEYAEVPFQVTYAGTGQQAFTQTTTLRSNDGVPIRNFGTGSTDIRREDLMRIAQPFLLARVKSHDQEEADLGLLRTALRRQVNPEWVYKLGLQSHNEGTPDHRPRENGIRMLRDDDDAMPLPPIVTPDILNAVLAAHTQNKQTGMASGVIMGTMPGAQTTGSAMDVLNTSGLEKWRPLVYGVEAFLTGLLEKAYRLYGGFGSILGADAQIGTLSVPRRNPNPRTGQAAAHELTPGIIRTHGIRGRVELRKFNPSNLSNLVNGLAIAYNMGVLDKHTIIDLIGVTNNPQAILDRIDEEMLDSVPEVKQEKTLRTLYREAQIAFDRGDLDSARDQMNRAYFIASQMQQKMMIGVPTDPLTGQPVMPGVPQPTQVATMTDPALTGLAGAQGGRPPGGGAPQPAGPSGPLVAG